MDTQKILVSSDSQKINTVERMVESAHQSDLSKELPVSDDRCSGGVCQVSWKPGLRPAA